MAFERNKRRSGKFFVTGVVCVASVRRGGEGKDERVKREKIGRGRIALGDLLTPAQIVTFLPFYGLPRRILPEGLF